MSSLVRASLRRVTPLKLLILFALVLIVLAAVVYAATPYVAFEAETGTDRINASVVSDSAAANGQALAFTGPACTPPDCPTGSFPTRATTGVPAGWAPVTTRNSTYTVTTAGAVVEDMRIINGDLLINAPNVTVRRVEIIGGRIENWPSQACQNGLLIEDTSILRESGQSDFAVVGTGGYTARRVKIDNIPEGFRVGGNSHGCGPVTIEDSFVYITPPDVCGDWHGDGIQGYDGPPLTIRNTVIEMNEIGGCGGTAPFFYPEKQGNVSADIDGLIVKGGGYPFRLGMPGSVRNLNIVNNSWGYGPISVKCSVVSVWDARIVTLDANGQPVTVRSQPCNTSDGG